MRPIASVNLFLKTRRVLIVTLASYLMTIQGVRRELNPQKINLNEFIDAMQTCGMQLGFDRDFALHLYGSKEDFNRTLCLSFCALRRLKLYSIEDEIKKELSTFGSGNDTRLINHVNKALKSCKNLLDDPCRLFDCLFDYARKIDNHEESALLAKFFSD